MNGLRGPFEERVRAISPDCKRDSDANAAGDQAFAFVTAGLITLLAASNGILGFEGRWNPAYNVSAVIRDGPWPAPRDARGDSRRRSRSGSAPRSRSSSGS